MLDETGGASMSLSNFISANHKEIAGSRTKNRLTVQISYAIQLIMDLYTTDYLVLMDYIEDISIITNPDNPSDIHLYQVKTKSTDKQYALSTVIRDQWYQKLYENAKKYNEFLGSASVVCNTDIVHSGKEVFPNAKTSLKGIEKNNNIKKLKVAIARDLNISENDVDLSKFYFVRSFLSVKGHKNEVEHEFENFLLEKDSELQVATVKSIYKLIYDKLDEKFNNEINEDCSDINEIFDKKGIDGREIESIVACGLAIQIPTPDKLFSEFGVTAISEKRKYSSLYTQIKMDMYSNISIFIKLKENLLAIIKDVNESGVEKMSELLEKVKLQAISNNIIPTAYRDEYYIKLLIMILIFRYSYGGAGT